MKDPVIVNSLFLKKPERIEALGLVLLLALLIWRLMERSMRAYVDTSGTPLTGWDHKATERPTTFMMVTKFAGVIYRGALATTVNSLVRSRWSNSSI